MEKELTYVYAYYDNKTMLERQIKEWQKYPDNIKQKLEVIITDDCSSKQPISELISKFKRVDFATRIFRITKKVPWNWLACRNIGAHYAQSKWVLLTDMDHMVDRRDVETFFKATRKGHDNWVYTLTRVDAPNRTYYKPHNDSFLMTKDLYWRIGGYDEELAGNYGTSGRYRQRAYAIAEDNKRVDAPLTRFPREVIADASTTEFVRKGPGRNPHAIKIILNKKLNEGREDEIRTLSFPYEEILF